MIQLDPVFTTTEAKEMTGFETPPPGGYVFKVVDVSDKPSKAGNDMISLSVDIAQGEFEGVFEKFPKMFFQLVNGDHLPYFKALLNHFKESNPPAKTNGLVNQALQFDAQKLKGLLIGGCLREAEYLNKDGDLCVGREVWYFCPVSGVAEIKTPKLKKLSNGSKPSTSGNKPSTTEDLDQLPF